MNQEMKALIEKTVECLLKQVEEHVPDYGDFAPIMEFFPNPVEITRDFVGTYGLKVYKMPNDVVPDPRMRYIQAAAYVPSGKYKSTMNVASGTKEEIIAIMQDPKLIEDLYESFQELEEQFEHYD